MPIVSHMEENTLKALWTRYVQLPDTLRTDSRRIPRHRLRISPPRKTAPTHSYQSVLPNHQKKVL
ncbi:hypothetical protein, partial [Brasilonema bromeliae]|uniref:hypothetical protein n=1 Tax=Brasilonema bromeliae TaxID=383615 RepID=UPI0030D73FA7